MGAINSGDKTQIRNECLALIGVNSAAEKNDSCGTDAAALATLTDAAKALGGVMPAEVAKETVTTTGMNGQTLSLLPGQAACKAAGQCVANDGGTLRGVSSATDKYALSCGGGCAVVGAGSGQLAIAGGLFTPPQVAKCSADGGGVDTYFTQASFNHPNINQPATQPAVVREFVAPEPV